MIDINTGDMTPLPKSIIRSLATSKFDRFAASSDGSLLAFLGEGRRRQSPQESAGML
jgi:hypothetical protein